MKKGISNIVAIILLLLMGIALIASLYVWSTSVMFDVYPEEQYNKTYLRQRACLSIEEIDILETEITLRNCGYVPLSEFQLYVDMLPVDFNFKDKLDPSESATGTFSEKYRFGTHKFYVTADLSESEIITAGIEGCINPLSCGLVEGEIIPCCPGYTCFIQPGEESGICIPE